MRAPWRCVLIGRETLLVHCATHLRERGHRIAAIVAEEGPARDWALAQQIPLLDHPNDLLAPGQEPFDHLFSITNLAILSPEVLALPRGEAINFHDGPLPAYAGLNTPVWALLNGEHEHGVSWHRMTAEVDAGALWATRAIAIEPGETAQSLNTKCLAAGLESFEQLVDRLAEGSAAPLATPRSPLRMIGSRDRPDAACTIDWTQPAADIANLVRALDYGAHPNPIGLPKTLHNGKLLRVATADPLPDPSTRAPGTIVRIERDASVVATATHDVRISLLDLNGNTPALTERDSFDNLTHETRARLTALDRTAAAHEPYWRRRLAALTPLDLRIIDRAAPAGPLGQFDAPLPPEPPHRLTAAAIACLARIADKGSFDIGYRDPAYARAIAGVEPWFPPQLPLGIDIDFAAPLGALDLVALDEARTRFTYNADLPARIPALRGKSVALPVALHLVEHFEDARPAPQTELCLLLRADGTACRWLYDSARIAPAMIGRLQVALETLLAASRANPEAPLGALALFPAPEEPPAHQPAPPEACIHSLFTEQAARTPDHPAVTCRNQSLSYLELDRRSNQLARHLQSLGVGPDRLVGLFMERSVELIVALIAVHKAGGAYVPLDPDYPADRIRHMIADSRACVILTQSDVAARLPAHDGETVLLDREAERITALSDAPVQSDVRPHHLAYVIYTSGSTGRPKGVMVEHRNVANFFAGMDERIAPGGVWLAVTSLSFDISVLELCWTLARGFHVILATGRELKGGAGQSQRALDFSLFYFAADESGEGGGKYRLLMEGAKFADTHGFTAVWTPERHFHAFGGLYPNPAVTGAAIAAVTQRVKIRGGSVVLPLHHPVRVAEEWALVDNLSNGRVGVAFASGWQPNDFVLRPEGFAERSSALLRSIEQVQSLWRGEAQSFPGPLGKDVAVTVLPRPVQPSLPFWITSAGNVETFAAAGRAGGFVLTHLLGQTLEELAEKIAAYRTVRREAGHAGEGHVTLMLHSFVGPDADSVRETVRGPMKAYLGTATALVRQHAWAFPAFKRRPGMEGEGAEADLDALSAEDMDSLLDHAFARYYATSGLFGTPETCLAMIARLRTLGVDEVACLIDFGVPTETVLAHLPHLDALRRLAQGDGADESLPALMARHGVTHLQCTPTLMQILLAEPGAREAVAALRHLMLGGEAFPPALARDVSALVGGTVSNMYGPTETTIWSSTHDLGDANGPVSLGRPLANQRLHIVDSRLQPLPVGVPGEILISGGGVVRGYLDRPELTAERFVASPFGRAYRTGDLARRREDGTLDFLGRLDHQVKLRGYRIELGEIEAALASHPDVHQSLVTLRDNRLLAYITGPASPNLLRDHISALLPDYMIPSQIIPLPAFPLTPNGKIDRLALPEPQENTAPDYAPPTSGTEEKIAAIWRDILKLDRIGIRDNFFDLGGHSLLAVQMHCRLKSDLSIDLPITDIFRFPNIQALSAHLSGDRPGDSVSQAGQSRAQGRLAALGRRRMIRASEGVR